MNARVPGATRLFDIVFIIVVINTVVQRSCCVVKTRARQGVVATDRQVKLDLPVSVALS